MKQMIENAKKVSDVVCVSMHWQDENITVPDSSQIAIMDKLLEYGADIIIGTGPHVLQPIEFKENGDGEQALVIWSLGNLVSCQKQRNNLLGGIADITVTKDSATGKITIKEATLIPTITHYNSNFSNVRIIPLVNYSEELASQHGTSSTFTYDYIVNFYTEMFGDRLKIKYK
jgi:poly-gamma-glutamate synthesis protein (capsule biosynthesis protein)